VAEHTSTQFSHSICPACMAKHFDQELAESGKE